MADRARHRVAPAPAPTKKQYAYQPCPRSEEVGTEFALQLVRGHFEPDQPDYQEYQDTTPQGMAVWECGRCRKSFFGYGVLFFRAGKVMVFACVA